MLGVVAMVLFAMNPLMKRGTQGMIKFVADQVGNQQNADQSFDKSGHLESSVSETNALSQTRTTEYIGNTTYIYDDRGVSSSTTSLNLGFSESN